MSNNRLIDLKNDINRNKNPVNETPKTVANIVKKSSTLINNKKVKDALLT